MEVASSASVEKGKQLLVSDGMLAGKKARVLVDCGATCSLVAEDFGKRNKIEAVEIEEIDIVVADGSKESSLDECGR